jgi:beta-N-acetylhexosaminidase
MRRRPIQAGIVCAVSLAQTMLISCDRGTSRATVPPAAPAPASPTAGTSAAVPKLTTAQLAGQRVVYSYRGSKPPATLLDRIRRGEAAGVIFFTANIPTKAKLRQAVAALNKANAQSPVKAPLLLMTDQEGGKVRRLSGAPTLSAKQIGRSAHPDAAATDAGKGAGQNLRSVGLNVNLAPVLDVYHKAGDFTDSAGRSFSSNPATVARLGTDFLKAQQATGVAATAKHFPGLGAATKSQNTDERPVTLKAYNETPYGPATTAGVRLVMLSWAVYPSLDSKRPAGLSHTIVQNELRQKAGFQGVTITDALEAGALKGYGSIPHRGVLAAEAGMDLLLYSAQDVNEGIGGLNELTKSLTSGRLDKTAYQQAVARVQALRAKL